MEWMFFLLLTVLLNFGKTEECGRPIGQTSEEGAWPWHAAIYREDIYSCGATLISKKHLITGAHCIARHNSQMPIDASKVKIRLGLRNLDKIDDSRVRNYSIEHITIHPEYNSTYFHNDIALLRVANIIEFNVYIQPICLWSNDDKTDRIGNVGTTVSWGITETKILSKELKPIEMPVVDRFNCISSNPSHLVQLLNSHNYCAGSRNGSSVCKGDSGSGLYFPRNRTENQPIWQLGGLLSVGLASNSGFCDFHNYVVFTDVPQFTDWIIKQQMEN